MLGLSGCRDVESLLSSYKLRPQVSLGMEQQLSTSCTKAVSPGATCVRQQSDQLLTGCNGPRLTLGGQRRCAGAENGFRKCDCPDCASLTTPALLDLATLSVLPAQQDSMVSAGAFLLLAMLIAAPAASQMTAQHTTDQTGDARVRGSRGG